MRSRIGRVLPSYLSSLIAALVANNVAVYEPAKQTRSVLLFWRLPEEWADVLHSWVMLYIIHSAPPCAD
jgi:ESCRT-II complex subunit VPS25